MVRSTLGRGAVIAALLILSSNGLSARLATASAAPELAAAECQKPAWTNNSSGTMKGSSQGYPTYYVRNGMNESCNITDQIGASVVVQADCYKTNSSGNNWIHIDWNSRTVSGWVYSGNLNLISGTLKPC